MCYNIITEERNHSLPCFSLGRESGSNVQWKLYEKYPTHENFPFVKFSKAYYGLPKYKKRMVES